MATAEIDYETLQQDGDIEVRLYAPYLSAEVIIDGAFDDAGSEAFKPLFNYISGGNNAQQDIAMTAPVTQTRAPRAQTLQGDAATAQWAVSFMIPAPFTLATAPAPTASNIRLRAVPARYMASITYSGLWSESNYQTHLTELNEWIAAADHQVLGEPVWARYDPPFQLWFLRRNEILIPINQPSLATR